MWEILNILYFMNVGYTQVLLNGPLIPDFLDTAAKPILEFGCIEHLSLSVK